MGGTKLEVLQKLQGRADRIATNRSYDSSVTALVKILDWPSTQ